MLRGCTIVARKNGIEANKLFGYRAERVHQAISALFPWPLVQIPKMNEAVQSVMLA